MKILLRSFSLLAGVILVLISAFNIPTPVWGVQVDLTVSTDRSFYNPGDLVKISGSLKVEGKPVEGALVALEVRDPLDNAAFVDQPASGQDGVFGSKFALRPDAPPGTYQVFASYLGKVATSQFSVGTPTSTQTATPSPTPTETPKPLPFSDLEGHWAYQYISELFSRGIVNGYPDGTFKPDRNVTRAEFCKLIVCTISIPLETEDLAKFTDLGTDHWAFKYIQTAFKEGIVKGRGGSIFDPDTPITRAEMATMVGRAFNLSSSSPLNFNDNQDIPSFAREFISALQSEGIITGFPDGSFRPQKNTTRAEACAVLCRILVKR